MGTVRILMAVEPMVTRRLSEVLYLKQEETGLILLGLYVSAPEDEEQLLINF